MPAWAINTQAALSSGDNLQVLSASEAIAANAGLKGFSFTPQATQVVLSILNNSGVALTIQKSVDNVTWLPAQQGGGAIISFPSGTATDYVCSTGTNYRLMNAVAITAGGAVWVAR
jgi:hypothetical protein